MLTTQNLQNYVYLYSSYLLRNFVWLIHFVNYLQRIFLATKVKEVKIKKTKTTTRETLTESCVNAVVVVRPNVEPRSAIWVLKPTALYPDWLEWVYGPNVAAIQTVVVPLYPQRETLKVLRRWKKRQKACCYCHLCCWSMRMLTPKRYFVADVAARCYVNLRQVLVGLRAVVWVVTAIVVAGAGGAFV